VRRRPLLVASIVLGASCLGGPLEHSNYFDIASGSEISIDGLPDTLYSVRDTFEFTVSSVPAFPSGIVGAAATFVSGRSLLTELGGFRFVPSGITVYPQSVTFAVHVNPVQTWPVDTQTVWMVQIPQTLALSCFTAGCQSVAVPSAAVAQVTGTDQGGGPLAIPLTAPGYGTATSSDTTVVRVTGQSGPRILYTAVGPGIATIQFSAAGLLATLVVNVTP
jgi:hypothetical protein